MEPDTDVYEEGSALDCTEVYNSYKPNELVPEINSIECENLGASNGLDGTKQTNCDDLSEMVCLIKQDVDAIATERAMVIAPNDASKCQEDNDPTLASFWSRVLRFSQAVTCILCEYDPFVATLLKQGKYPEILMGAVQTGADGTGYPQWVMPDETPTEGSVKPVMSSGVVTAVQEAILSVWHLWEEYPEFTYFAPTYDDADSSRSLLAQSEKQEPSAGDTALVANNGTQYNLLYTYGDSGWTLTKVLGEADKLTNFAVTHIVKGYYADKAVYYFHDGNQDTWQVMDVDFTELEKRVEELEKTFGNAVLSADDSKQFMLTTAPTLEAANSTVCVDDKTIIVLVTG